MCLHQIVFHSLEETIGRPGIPFGPETGLFVCEPCLHACFPQDYVLIYCSVLRCSFGMMCSCNLFFGCPGTELLSSTEEECCFWGSEVQEVLCCSLSLSCFVFNEQNLHFSVQVKLNAILCTVCIIIIIHTIIITYNNNKTWKHFILR